MSPEASIIGFIPVRDANRSRAFYEGVLGLTFVSEDEFATVLRSGKNMLRLVKMGEFTPARFTILGWEVTDAAREAASLTAAGVEFQRHSFVQQDELGIWTTPNGDRVAWFTDPDGNVLSVSQHA